MYQHAHSPIQFEKCLRVLPSTDSLSPLIFSPKTSFRLVQTLLILPHNTLAFFITLIISRLRLSESRLQPAKKIVYGARLSMADLKRIRGCVSSFGGDCLLPHLESLAARLGAHIAHTRKSALSSARKWLGFSSSEKKQHGECVVLTSL